MTYSAIADVTTAIVELLREHATQAATPLDPSGIEAVAPDAVDSLSGLELAVYPYRVATDNRAGTTVKQLTGTTRTDPPLTLSVRYLLIAYTDHDETRAEDGDGRPGPLERGTSLGAALQILHDNQHLDPDDSMAALYQNEPLTITFVDEPLDEMLSLWAQFEGASYRPTAAIEVAPVVIQSLNEEEFTRVDERETRVGRHTDGADTDESSDRLDIPDNS